MMIAFCHSNQDQTFQHSLIQIKFINSMDIKADTKETLLPQITSKVSVNLSPFTWTNLKLPPFNPIKQKAKSVSQKSSFKPQRDSQTSHLKTIKEQPKVHKDNHNEKSKVKKQQSKASKALERLEAHTATQIAQPKQQNQRYRLKSKIQRLNKTIEIVRNQQSTTQQQKAEPKRIRFLDDKNNMEKYIKANLARVGWSSSGRNQKNEANLLWSNIDKISDHHNLKDGQFYNHLNGSFHLTNKDKLHEIMSAKQYYPKSFLIPKQYEQFAKENNRIAAKRMLKVIAKQIGQFVDQDGQGELMQVNLWQILESSILMMGNEETTMLVKLCMYLQEVRRHQKHTQYFQNFQNYRHLNLNTKEHFYDALVQKSFAYLQAVKVQYLTFTYKDIDYRLLMIILHYHHLFLQYDQTYNQQTSLWIIKPIASSRGAGISIVRSLREFCINPDNMWSQFKNRKKYQNKIIQKYVSNPYILQKPHEFSGRKFDIRQWVLVTNHRGKPIIYKYHTGYCRFSHEQFTINKLGKEIHLTNYSIFKNTEQSANIPSTLMLEDLFSVALGDLRTKFNQQANSIITDSILSCNHIKYQQGCFQLFGFDFLLDSAQKLYLLQVNLNPACNAQRHPKLKEQSELMSKTMISLITESRPSDKWVRLYGAAGILDSQSQGQASQPNDGMEIKPYYQYQLTDDQSLLAYIRYKSRVVYRMMKIAQNYLQRSIFSRLNNQKHVEGDSQASKANLNELIHFIEEKSVSNL